MMFKKFFLLFSLVGLFSCVKSQNNYVKENYDKIDTTITMRDGIKLYTIIYVPKDNTRIYPILMERTPYSAGPYGENNYKRRLGPNEELMKGKYIFVYQDVRGRYMSEGHNKEVTPYIPDKKSNKDVDESSDTYDTVDWLVKNIEGNNGKVGLYGISYPGFYATTSLPGAHPAIKAVSPQAPVTDEFIGDDANHNGAFFLLDNFMFMNYFGKNRNGPVEDYGGSMFSVKTNNVYDFFLKLGPVKNTQSSLYFDHKSYIWNQYLEHDTYDEFWRSRNIRQYLKNIKIPTLVVGGWFDAEDLFGALHTFRAIDTQGGENNFLVMGPWTHGAWASGNWSKFGSYNFGMNTAKYFQDSIQTIFFNYYLKGEGSFGDEKATVFETGKNEWHQFDKWPPSNSSLVKYYFTPKNGLSTERGKTNNSFLDYVSDPSNPVPYTARVMGSRNNLYMIEDQTFASKRADVVTFTSPMLNNDLTVAGPLSADLYVSMSSTDADFIVKVIDDIPLPSEEVSDPNAPETGNYQRLVRAEVFRGKFRNNYSKPEAFVPGRIEKVHINLNDIFHDFKKGHRIMVQVQSSWFPLVDMNPQKFISIPKASESDFQKAQIKIYTDSKHPSSISLPVMR